MYKAILNNATLFTAIFVLSSLPLLAAPALTAAEQAQADQMKAFENRITTLERPKRNKVLRPYRDIDFLEEAVLGQNYFIEIKSKNEMMIEVPDPKEPNDPKKNIKISKEIIGIRSSVSNWGELFNHEPEISVEYMEKKAKKVAVQASARTDMLNLKLTAIENKLGINTKGEEKNLILRINNAYGQINHTDWQNDDFRWGVLTSMAANGRIITNSLVLQGYFGYRRFTPGKWDLSNLGRRISSFIGAGIGNSFDSGEIRGPVLTVGLGFDMVKGMSLAVGYSFFAYRSSATETFAYRDSLSLGITLNTDLWSALFATK